MRGGKWNFFFSKLDDEITFRVNKMAAPLHSGTGVVLWMLTNQCKIPTRPAVYTVPYCYHGNLLDSRGIQAHETEKGDACFTPKRNTLVFHVARTRALPGKIKMETVCVVPCVEYSKITPPRARSSKDRPERDPLARGSIFTSSHSSVTGKLHWGCTTWQIWSESKMKQKSVRPVQVVFSFSAPTFLPVTATSKRSTPPGNFSHVFPWNPFTWSPWLDGLAPNKISFSEQQKWNLKCIFFSSSTKSPGCGVLSRRNLGEL